MGAVCSECEYPGQGLFFDYGVLYFSLAITIPVELMLTTGSLYFPADPSFMILIFIMRSSNDCPFAYLSLFFYVLFDFHFNVECQLI